MTEVDVQRYAAFTDDPRFGNPAGVVLDATGLGEDQMHAIAAEVGYSETAFLRPGAEPGDHWVRYFSPVAEVPFCGHATIASAVALAVLNSPRYLVLRTRSGPVGVRTEAGAGGGWIATLTSPPAHVDQADAADVAEALAALGWEAGDLDPSLPPRVAFAGAHHLVVAAATRERLAHLDYDVSRLSTLMHARGWTTVQLVWREAADRFHSRNPFPAGDVTEDPATGAAAAALGGYLRELGEITPPAQLTILQGEDLGRPSTITVDVIPDRAEVDVSGTAVSIPAVPWLPEGFVHPSRVELMPGYHLRPIRATDVDLDMVAVMASRARLWAKYGDAWGWPPEGMTRQADEEDLAHHEAEADAHESFNYAVWDGDEGELLGCVYIDPPDEGSPAGTDAVVSWWVVDAQVGSALEQALEAFVPRWLTRDWGFRRLHLHP